MQDWPWPSWSWARWPCQHWGVCGLTATQRNAAEGMVWRQLSSHGTGQRWHDIMSRTAQGGQFPYTSLPSNRPFWIDMALGITSKRCLWQSTGDPWSLSIEGLGKFLLGKWETRGTDGHLGQCFARPWLNQKNLDTGTSSPDQQHNVWDGMFAS